MEGLRNGRRASGSRESNGFLRDQSYYASMQLGTTRRSLLKSHRLTRGHRGKSGTALRFQKRLRIQESATQFARPSMFPSPAPDLSGQRELTPLRPPDHLCHRKSVYWQAVSPKDVAEESNPKPVGKRQQRNQPCRCSSTKSG